MIDPTAQSGDGRRGSGASKFRQDFAELRGKDRFREYAVDGCISELLPVESIFDLAEFWAGLLR